MITFLYKLLLFKLLIDKIENTYCKGHIAQKEFFGEHLMAIVGISKLTCYFLNIHQQCQSSSLGIKICMNLN